jgi:hypothetical protein
LTEQNFAGIAIVQCAETLYLKYRGAVVEKYSVSIMSSRGESLCLCEKLSMSRYVRGKKLS